MEIIALMSIGILTLVLCAKWVKEFVKRRRLQEKMKKLEEENGAMSESEDEVSRDAKALNELAEKHFAGACDKVIHEEYEYQSSVGTKRAVNNLTSTSSYKEMLRKKGTDVEGWNW